MKIRLATPKDYKQVAEIRNLIYPDIHETADKLVESDRVRDKKINFCRWVAEIDNKIVGDAYYSHQINFYHPNKFEIDIVILPEYQNKGIGTALYQAVTEALKQFDPIQYHANAQDKYPSGLKFLSKHGFKEVARERIAHLDVKTVDIKKYKNLEQKLSDKNIIFKNLHELKDDSDYDKQLYELEWEMINDMPGVSEPFVKQTFEEWFKHSLNHPEIIHDAFHVALKDNVYIGYSYLWGGSDKVLVHNGMTGVKKEFRGQGIASILKALGIGYAQENSFEILWTCNSVANKSVLSINEKLGYKTQYEIVEMTKNVLS